MTRFYMGLRYGTVYIAAKRNKVNISTRKEVRT